MNYYKVRFLAVVEVDVREENESDAIDAASAHFGKAQQGIAENFGVWVAGIAPGDMGETLAAGQTEVWIDESADDRQGGDEDEEVKS